VISLSGFGLIFVRHVSVGAVLLWIPEGSVLFARETSQSAMHACRQRIGRSLFAAAIVPVTKELAGLSRMDGKRPDGGLTLVP